MINLDQVRTLEWKVKQAVQLIGHLRKENDSLRGRVSETEVKLQELEALMDSFKAAQSEMETGIRNALEDLDHLESDSPPSDVPVQAVPEEQEDSVSSVPEAESVSVIVESLAGDEPVAATEAVPSPESSSEDEAVASSESVVGHSEDSSSFEAEFAALVEAEEQGESEEVVSEASTQDHPESVELETDSPQEEETNVDPPSEQQPGLGIF